MLNLFKKKETFKTPIKGELIAITEVNDQVFSQKMMGDGFAIIPSENTVISPLSGTVDVVFPTKHAIGIKSNTGIEFIIHIGIDTVKLNGEGFTSYVKQGQKISQGEKLVTFDLDLIKSKGYDTSVIVIFPNNDVKLNLTPTNVDNLEVLNIKF